MLERLEMHDIQDKTRLLDEMNETRDGVNKVRVDLADLTKKVSNLMKTPEASQKPKDKPKGSKSKGAKKPKTGPVKGNPQRVAPGALGLGPKPD